MYTVWFAVPALRPDYARFATDTEAAEAAHTLMHRIHAGRSIRLTISHAGTTVYSFERKLSGS